MKKINWEKVREQFEKDLSLKLQDLPDHRKVPENLREFRHLISHELPEIAPLQLFEQLVNILLKGERVDLKEIKNKYLNPLLKKEKQILERSDKGFAELRKDASKWIKENSSEEELGRLWKEHKTWLPRRHKVYKNKKASFQEIAAHTLARYALIGQFSVRTQSSAGHPRKIS